MDAAEIFGRYVPVELSVKFQLLLPSPLISTSVRFGQSNIVVLVASCAESLQVHPLLLIAEKLRIGPIAVRAEQLLKILLIFAVPRSPSYLGNSSL